MTRFPNNAVLATAAALIFTMPGKAAAADPVALSSKIAVEHTVMVAGKPRTQLSEPKVVVPGDKLVFTILYRNTGGKPVNDFVVTNPIPTSVRFAGQASAGALVSVDGGSGYGLLPSLQVHGLGGEARAAANGDVTHIRWKLASIAPGASGTLTFRGEVR